MSIEIRLPQWGMSMSEGTVTKWLVAEGEEIQAGQELVEIEAAKVTDVVTTPEAGVVEQILVHVDETVEVNAVLCTVGSGDATEQSAPAATGTTVPDNAAAAEKPPQQEAVAGAAASAPDDSAAEKPPQQDAVANTTETHPVPRDADAARAGSGRVTGVVPLARKLATEHDVDLRTVTGSGNQGRIVVADVQAAIDSRATTQPPTPRISQPIRSQPAPESSTQERAQPISHMRSVIGQRMVDSLHQTAQFTLTSTADVSAFSQLRNEVAAGAMKPSYVDAVVRACALALAEHPQLNSRLENQTIIDPGHISVGFAVAVNDGLLVPVIKHTDQLGLAEISAATSELAQRARDGQLSADELDGGTFSVTSLGGQGIDYFTPILNPPQSAILGVGRTSEVPARYGDGLIWKPELPLSLTIDHRINDGYPSALFLADVVALLEDPKRLF